MVTAKTGILTSAAAGVTGFPRTASASAKIEYSAEL